MISKMKKYSCETCNKYKTDLCPLVEVYFPLVPNDLKTSCMYDSTHFTGCMSHHDVDYKLKLVQKYLEKEIVRAKKDYKLVWKGDDVRYGTEAYALERAKYLVDMLIDGTEIKQIEKLLKKYTGDE
jgi:hypothetical protein